LQPTAPPLRRAASPVDERARPNFLGTKTAVALGVAALTIGAFALRLYGIGYMLPHVMESDGGVIMRQVMLMHSDVATPEFEDNWAFYPHLVARLIAMWPDAEKWRLASNDLAGHLAQASAPLLQARIGVAAISTLLVPGTWLFARRFLSRAGAFFAAASMSISLLAVWFSQQSRPHGPAAMTALFAVVAAMHMRARPTFGMYALAGVAAGLAIGTLQSGIAVLFPLFAAHLLRERDPDRPSAGRYRILVALAVIAAIGCALYPFLLIPTSDTNSPKFEYTGKTFEFFGHSIFLDMFTGKGFATTLLTLWSFETVTSLLALGAIATWLFDARSQLAEGSQLGSSAKLARRYWRAHPDLCVALAYVVPYFIVIGLYDRTFERFVLQLLPYAIVLAAAMVVRATRWLADKSAPEAAAIALVAVALAVPAFGTTRMLRLRAAPDSLTLAARWIEKNVRPAEDRVLLIPFVDVPLWHSEASLAAEADLGWTSPWQVYQTRLDGRAVEGDRYDLRQWPFTKPAVRDLALKDPIAFAKEVHAAFVIINVPNAASGDPVRPVFRKALGEHAELALRVPADARGIDGEPVVLFEDMPAHDVNWTLALLHRFAAIGPVIEIYRIR
jgi:hypothetical protein